MGGRSRSLRNALLLADRCSLKRDGGLIQVGGVVAQYIEVKVEVHEVPRVGGISTVRQARKQIGPLTSLEREA
jgi:hypothetical protein